MKWYYSRRGKNFDHGLVEESDLHKMASEGQLSPDDLVWIQDTGKAWQRADTIPGLFPEPKPAPEPEPIEIPVESPEKDLKFKRRQLSDFEESDGSVPKSATGRKIGIIQILIIVMIAGGILFVLKGALSSIFGGSQQEEVQEEVPQEPEDIPEEIPEEVPEEAPEEPVEEPLIPEEFHLEEELIDEDPVMARKMFDALPKAVRINPKAIAFDKKLRKIETDRKRLLTLKKALVTGTLENSTSAQQLKDLWYKYDDRSKLPAYLRTVAASRSGTKLEVKLSLLHVVSSINDLTLLSDLLASSEKALNEKSSAETCLRIAQLCGQRGLDCTSLLAAFLMKQPESPMVLLEHAAVQSANRRTKEALQSLKKATSLGGDPVKKKARADKRFDAIRKTRAFKRYVD